MRRGLAQQRIIAGVTTLVAIALIAKAVIVRGIMNQQYLWARLNPMHGVSTICTAMCGNGLKIVCIGD